MELSGIDTGKGLRLVRRGSQLQCSDSTAKPTTFRSSSDGGVISSNPQRSRRLFGSDCCKRDEGRTSAASQQG